MKERPNFDDERTLLTARRVVPLEKIDAKERHRKQWFLGSAFAIAMLLGAASALLASYMKLRNVPAATAEMSEVETPAEPTVAAEESVSNALPAVENMGEAQNTEELVVPVTPQRAPVVRRRAPANNPDLIRPRVVQGGDEEEALDRIREAVLVDVWQERRARRAARRDRQNRLDHHDRDLSNLDEIFEGPRQRRRPRP